METDRISSRWGLKGRADAIFRSLEDSIIVELKTGKVPVPEHLLQLHAYRLLFASTGPKTNLDGYVVYSATGRAESLGDVPRSSTRAVLEGRNRVVALKKSYTDSEAVIPAHHTCERNGICFARKDCLRLFGEEQNQQLFFTPMERDYYDRWFKLLSLEVWAQQEAFARILDPRTLDSRLAEGVTIRVLLARLLDRIVGPEDVKSHASENRLTASASGHETKHAMSLDIPIIRMLLSVPEDGLDLNRGDEIILHRGRSTGPEAFRARIDATEAGSVTVSLKSAVAYTSAPIQLPADTLREPEGWFLDRLPFSGGPEVSSRGLFNFFVRADRGIVDVVVGGEEKPGADQSPDKSFQALEPRVPGEPLISGASEDDTDSAVPQDLCYSEGLLSELNEDQEAAVEAAFHSPTYQLVHGPPGTGKTRVLARLIKMCLDHGERVLVSCPTNVAVDRLLLAVIELGVRGILRIGGNQAVSHEFLEAARRLGNPPALLHDLASLNRDMRAFRKVVAETMLVCATAYQCAAHPFFRRQRFDRVVVDEAGQVDEPSTLGPVALAPKFVLGGDHLQLPPIVQASGINATGGWDAALDQSLFERLYRSAPRSRVSTLRLQYRMNREVQEIPSRLFYGGELEPAAEVAQRRLKISVGSNDDLQMEKILAPENPVVFVDVPGSDGGKWRVAEAAAASRIAKVLLARGVPAWEVGIITPYRAQQSLIKRELAAGHQERPFLAVDTVDRFQGGEREVIILSLARSDGVTSFLADRKRLNVSLSRARSKLILVGHGQTLEEHPLFCAVLAGLERITI